MSTESKYIVKDTGDDGKEHITILEEGQIDSTNLHSMSFTFGAPADITADLEKRNKDNPDPEAPSNDGRTGYAGIQITYPDGQKSSKVALRNCILQYRESAFKDPSKPNAANYGLSYVQVGIPSNVIHKLYTEGKKQNVTLENRRNVREKNGYHWVNCNIAKLDPKFISSYVQDGDQTRVANDVVRTFLEVMECNLFCTLTATISCTTTTSVKTDTLDLKKAIYHLTIRPFEITVEEETDIKGPDLTDISIQTKNETAEVTEKNVARGALAEKMLARLKIGK